MALMSLQPRRHLDRRSRDLGPATRFAPPVRGWIRAIRDALGMTTAQLAKRLNIAQPSVVALEQSEAKGSIELATLRRAAAALDCTVVYALIPNRPLETMVRERARQVLLRQLEPIDQTMLLEDQQVSREDFEAQLDEFIRETNLRRLWD